jgi:hypothetical protein
MKTRLLSLTLAVCALLSAPRAFCEDIAGDMKEAATRFLAALQPEQRDKASFEISSDERLNWHFIPRERKGLPVREMTSEQKALAHGLLNSGLSQRGYLKASTIMSLEQILRDMEKGSGPRRDPEGYFFSFFGKPADGATWGWRVEGHHLALNFSIVDGKFFAATPSFMGTNPGEVREGPRKGLRTLAAEEDLARKLARSLDADQKKTGILMENVPGEIITGADRKARNLDPRGVKLSQLNAGQKELFWLIVGEYVGRARGEFAEKELAAIKQGGEENLYFGWVGSVEPKQPHYYRIQGSTFLIEYDNTQNNANHVHAVWRDLNKDFGGEDFLRKHYDQDHKNAK